MNWWRLFDLCLFAVVGYLAGMQDAIGSLVMIISLAPMLSLLEEGQ